MKRIGNIGLIWMGFLGLAAAQTSPTGNDNQGGVGAPAGYYAVTPSDSSINAYTANATRVVTDLDVPSVSEVGLTWTRFNNTRTTAGSQWLGAGGNWRHSYQWDFAFTTVSGVSAIELVYPNGVTNYFTQTSTNTWTSTSAVSDIITASGSQYILTRSDNVMYVFTSPASGVYLMTSIIDSKNQTTTLAYDASYKLTSVTEPGGRTLTVAYASHHVTESWAYDGEAKAWTLRSWTSVPYIATVTASDTRQVSYNYQVNTAYTLVGSNRQYTLANYVAGTTYPDASTAAYTYSTSTTAPTLTTANDTRTKAIPKITYTYYTGISVPGGAVRTVTETSSGTAVASTSLNASNAQSPVITHVDSSVYSYSVDAGGLLASVANTLSNANTFAYSSTSGSWTVTSTDANSNSVATTRSVGGRLLSRSWPKVGSETTNPTETWTYNTAGYLTSYTDTRNHTTTFTRAPSSNLVTQISYPDGTSESFTYTAFNKVLTHTRRNGGVEHFTYTPSGLLQTEQDAMGNTTTLAYNSNYRVSSMTNARTNTTSFVYNDRGQITKITHPDGTYISTTYNAAGDVLTKTDEIGHVWTFTYDAFHRLLTSKDPLTHTTTYAYSTPKNAHPTLITSPTGKKISYVYAAAWGYQETSQTVAYGTSDVATTSYTYDSVDNLLTAKDPRGNTTTYTYDPRERKSTLKDPLGNVTSYNYDDASNVTSWVTPAGTTFNVYDAMNRLTLTTSPLSQVTAYTYDPEGQVKTETDPNTNVYTYSYDYDERKTALKYPDNSTESNTYDPDSDLSTYTTRDGKVQTYSYDNRDRCTGYSWSDGVTPSMSEGYDAASRVTSISNSTSALSYTYDNANEVLSETQNIVGLGSKAVSYSYYTDGTLDTLTYPDTTVLTYSYNNRNQVSGIAQGSTAVGSYTYDSDGDRSGRTLGNGVTSTLVYDTDDRLTSLSDSFSGTTLETFAYGYDAMSRKAYVQRANGLGDVYGYDNSNQITSVQYNCTNPATAPSSPSQTVSYTYDSAGNRTRVVDSLHGTTSSTPNSDNQYTTWAGLSASYDGRGNLTLLNGSTYTYDAQNRMISGISGSNTATFAYDPLGRCVKRVQNGSTTYAVYDISWNVLADFNSSGTQTGRYIHGAATDEIVSKTDNTNTTVYYHNDALGNVTMLTSSAGVLLEQYSYDIFGAATIRNASGTVISASAYANRYLFAAKEWISVLGLYGNRSRMYSAAMGRFLQVDPSRFVGSVSNLYNFNQNNPLNLTDIFGDRPTSATVYQASWGAATLTGSVSAGLLIVAGLALAPETGGLSLGLAWLGASSAGIGMVYGAANIGAAFSPDDQLALETFDAPQTVLGTIGRIINPSNPALQAWGDFFDNGLTGSAALASSDATAYEKLLAPILQGIAGQALSDATSQGSPESNPKFWWEPAPFAMSTDANGFPVPYLSLPTPYAAGLDEFGLPKATPVTAPDGSGGSNADFGGNAENWGLGAFGMGMMDASQVEMQNWLKRTTH